MIESFGNVCQFQKCSGRKAKGATGSWFSRVSFKCFFLGESHRILSQLLFQGSKGHFNILLFNSSTKFKSSRQNRNFTPFLVVKRRVGGLFSNSWWTSQTGGQVLYTVTSVTNGSTVNSISSVLLFFKWYHWPKNEARTERKERNKFPLYTEQLRANCITFY